MSQLLQRHKSSYYTMLLLATLFSQGCVKMEKDPNLWEELTPIEHPDYGRFKVHQLHRTVSGTLIVAGYFKKDQYDCGLAGSLNCSLFEIYRSVDDGTNWQDVSDPYIAQRHAFINDDKIKGRRLPVRNWLRSVKDVVTPVIYADQWNTTFISSEKDEVFLFVNNAIYVSEDEGVSWKNSTPKESPIQIEVDRNDPIGFFNSRLIFRQRANNVSYVYSRRRDHTYKRVNIHENKSWQNFTIFHSKTGHAELISPGNRLSNHYYLNDGLLTRKKNEREKLRIHEVYETKNGAYYAVVVHAGGIPTAPDYYWWLWKSEDKGKTFSKMILYGGDEETLYDQVRIIGRAANYFVLMVSERRKKFMEPGKGNVRFNKFYLLDTETARLSTFVFPTSWNWSINEVFNFTFDSQKEVIYLSMMNGIFKTKEEYSTVVMNEEKYQKSH